MQHPCSRSGTRARRGLRRRGRTGWSRRHRNHHGHRKRGNAPGRDAPFSPIKVFSDLVEREYPPGTLRNIAQAICEQVRTGDPASSHPWREMIGYIGERRVGAFIAYSVATYCPEDGEGLIDLMGAHVSQGG